MVNLKTIEKEFKIGDVIKAKFASMNKNNTLLEYKKECKKEETYIYTQDGGNGYPTFREPMKNWRIEKCLIKKVIKLSDSEFKHLSKNLLEDNIELFEKIGGSEYTGTNKEFSYEKLYSDENMKNDYRKNHVTLVVLVINEDRPTKMFVVNTEGYLYARYVGINVGSF